jgi:tetratricopeptide (TPR) repeat protein
VASARPNLEGAQIELVTVLAHQARVYYDRHQFDLANLANQRALAIAEALRLSQPSSPALQLQLGQVLRDTSVVQRLNGELPAALQNAQASVSLLEKLPPHVANGPEARVALSACWLALAKTRQRLSDVTAARDDAQHGVALLEGLDRYHPNDTVIQRNLTLAYIVVGGILGRPTLPNLGDSAGAEKAYRQAAKLAAGITRADPYNQTARRDHSAALTRLATALPPDRAREALGVSEQALDLFQKAVDADPENHNLRMGYASLSHGIAQRKLALGDLTGALASVRNSETLARQAMAGGEPEVASDEFLDHRAGAGNPDPAANATNRRSPGQGPGSAGLCGTAQGWQALPFSAGCCAPAPTA